MFEASDPRQVTLFPDLATGTTLPSITTQPEFDQALANLVRISDLGAFVQLNISGVEKSYTLNLAEMAIPADFLKTALPPAQTIQLFSPATRRQLQKLVYSVKAFFNNDNSLPTEFGPFLLRPFFTDWQDHLAIEREIIQRSVKKILGRRTYSQLVIEGLTQGYNLLQSAAEITAPWEFEKRLTISKLKNLRRRLLSSEEGLDLNPTAVDYPLWLLVQKTIHLPLTLAEYQQQIQITSFFKTIHITHLVDKDINSIEDIKSLINQF